MTNSISKVDFKEWEIYALSESDYLSTYIFSYIGNNNLKLDEYIKITFSEEEGGIESSVGSYDLFKIKGHLELGSIINLWIEIYNKASEQWDDIYWEEYKNIDSGFEPLVDQEDSAIKILATINANKRFKQNNLFSIHSLNTEKEEYSFCGITIKLKPTEKDLDRFYGYSKDALKKENNLSIKNK